MKKLLLFIFILLGFVAVGQEEDEYWARDSIYIRDTSVTNLIKQHSGAGTTITFGSEYEIPVTNSTSDDFNYDSGLKFYGDSLVVDNNSIVHGNVGIGTTNPLSALHLNKGTGIANGVTFDATASTGIYLSAANQMKAEAGGNISALFSTLGISSGTSSHAMLDNTVPTATIPGHTFWADFDLGIGRAGEDQGSLIAGGKEIARFSENVTEQLIINPQGDLTGTLAAPNFAFTNSDLTRDVGFFLASDNNLVATVNSIEAMRLTEDTIFIDSTFAPLQIKFPDGTIQTTAASGDLTGVMQVAKAEILYTNTSQTTIITLPLDAVIWDIGVNVTTLFNDSGTDLLDVGITGTGNKYLDDIDISSVFFDTVLRGQLIAGTNIPNEMTGSTNITFQYIGQNTDATQGIADVHIHYTTP